MFKQMWLDLTTGWGTWRDWGLGLVLVCFLVTFGVVVLGLPILFLWWAFGIHPDTGTLIVLTLLGLGCWAYSAYERTH